MIPDGIGSKQLICISGRIQSPHLIWLWWITEARGRICYVAHDTRFATRTPMAFLNLFHDWLEIV